ncbi:MAG: ADOP family duplicated permease, partial [Gemmatimonadota bacterium]|nr:ADOP family duplicated permease [Gemmatimonadota bacterium]
MAWLGGVIQRLRETIGRERAESELDEEIRYHLEREIERLVEEGMSPGRAAAEARRRFGGVRRVKENAREEFGFRWLERVARDIRYAARGLRKHPAFAFAAVLTLGLGIGAVTAIFSVLNGVVLRPLPYADADRVVHIRHTDHDGDNLGMPDGGYFFYGENANSLEEMAAYLELSQPVTGTGRPLELAIILATPSLFDVLRVSPVRGRLFTQADAEPGAPDVALITHAFWLQHFGGDPEVVGRELVDDLPWKIIGVLPPDFEFVRPEASIVFGNSFREPQVLAPLTMRQSEATFGNFMYQSLARLAPDATAAEAERELTALVPRAAEAYPGGHTVQSLEEGGHRPVVRTVKQALVGGVAGTLWILLGAVGLVLLIGTANVANLVVARAESRRREIAVRRSLGAGLGALARASVVEGVLLAIAGGLLGLALAAVGAQVLLSLAPPDIPRLENVGVDPAVLLFAGGLTLVTGVLFGLFPLLSYARHDARAALGDEARGSTAGRSRQRVRRGLVVVQVAFALVLLVAAGLLLRTFDNLRTVDPGFDSSNVLTLRLSLHGLFDGELERSQFMNEVTRRLEAIPGVEVASFSGDLPLDGDEWRDDVVVEGPVTGEPESPDELRVFMGPRYLEAIGARLVRGRELERGDFVGYPRFAVVNERFAAERWPGQDPIGKRLMQGGNDPDADVWYTVSGVVGDIREMSLMDPPEATVYLPTVFLPDDAYGMFVQNMPIVIRTSVAPTSLFPAVEREIRAVAPEIPMNSVMTLAEIEARSFQQVSFAMVLILVASIVAVILGVIGIYGVVSYLVSLRSREFGLR